jgi:hypothetical protein
VESDKAARLRDEVQKLGEKEIVLGADLAVLPPPD